ncbi:MAG: DUF4258 domain-containing protein [Candidatus Bathyarchaeia archaeon]
MEFSGHAMEKMRKRGVNVAHVYNTLESPKELFEDIEHDVMVAIKKVDDKFVIVVFREEDGVVKVITLYYTTKFERLVKSKMVRGAWKRIK